MIKAIRLLATFIFVAVQLLSAQEKFTVNGYVRDASSGESLSGAVVSVQQDGKGVSTNVYGFYSITLPAGNYQLTCSYVGYQSQTVQLQLKSGTNYDFNLQPNSTNLEQVTVIARKRENQVKSAQMGKLELNMNTVKTLPAFLGEADLLKTLQLLPGVRNAGEGNAGFYVRGGGPDQNLILLDDAVVYNTGHLFGFFSVFNPDAVKNVTLIKGGMPAQYGGRLSSVVEVNMKEGNRNDWKIDAGIGLIASRFSVQGPVKKDKSSFMLSARRTYIDALVKPFVSRESNFYGSGYYFYDVNAKFNHQFSEKDKIYVSGYFGRDQFNFSNTRRSFSTDVPWGNATGTVRWNHVFSRKMFSNLTLVYNDYNFAFQGTQRDFTFRLSSGIRDFNAKYDFDYFVSPEHRLKFGAQYTFHTFFPNLLSSSQGSTVFSPDNASRKQAHEWAGYIQDDWEIGKKVKLNYGLRYSFFSQVGPYTMFRRDADGNKIDSTIYGRGDRMQSYGGLEPRATLRYSINDQSSFKAAITRNIQYIHLVTNAGTTLPTDLWVPSTIRVRPQLGMQYAAGFFHQTKSGMFETSVELYYKTMENQIEYREGYTPSLRDPEEDFVFGKGWSYGAEFLINKTKGQWTGWLGYTLSWTWRRFPDLNQGDQFPSRFDRRHDLSFVNMYTLNKKWKLSATFIYGSGNAFTMPERFYFVGGVLTQEFSRINAYRLPAYHRLDFSATYTPVPKKERKWKSSWVFALYNAYSRLNPYFIYFDQEGSLGGGDLRVTAKQVSLFPVIPSVTWNVSF